MALVRKNPAAAATFEEPTADTAADTSAPFATDEEAAQTAAPAATSGGVDPAATAPAAAAPRAVPSLLGRAGALVAKSNVDMNVIKNLKNAYQVQYDSLANITATQGRFAERESKVSMGTEILFELLSYQDQYVVSPNDDKAGKELVRYSADGVVCSDGTLCTQHLADLKEMGWKNARVNQRYVLVGAVIQTEKTDKFDGALMQIDLSPKSKGQFDRYLIQSAFDLGKGKITAEQAKVLSLKAEVAENAMKQSYTLVRFETYKDPAPAA